MPTLAEVIKVAIVAVVIHAASYITSPSINSGMYKGDVNYSEFNYRDRELCAWKPFVAWEMGYTYVPMFMIPSDSIYSVEYVMVDGFSTIVFPRINNDLSAHGYSIEVQRINGVSIWKKN